MTRRRTTTVAYPRRASAALVLAILAALVVAPGIADRPATAELATAAREQTRQIQRGDKGPQTATVRVSTTEGLINRQVLRLSWSGLVPSHRLPIVTVPQNEAVPYTMEYPVVILQCSKPEPAREDCYFNRTMANDSSNASYWDALQPEQQRGLGWRPSFRAANRETPYAPTEQPSDFGTSNFAGNTMVEPTGPDGTRSDVRFEVRDQVTTPSLGCSASRKCSLVVIPVMELVCAPDAAAPCSAGPTGPVGGPNNSPEYNETLAPGGWALESNWRNRFVVPIEFAPADSTCATTDPRPQRALVGAETADLALRRWTQAMCVDREAPRLAHVRQSEEVARNLLLNRSGEEYGADAALVTRPVTGSPRPLAHAPVLATGVAVAFAVDVRVGDDAPYELRDLRLSPRLLAKLMTQSYQGTFFFNQAHPAVSANPVTLFHDKEFLALNPDYPQDAAGGPTNGNNASGSQGLTVITNDSDAYYELTRYVTADPEAVRWLGGEADEYGTTVNPVYRGTPFPSARFELRDEWVPEGVPCGPLPGLTRVQHVAPSLEGGIYSIADSQGLNQECVNTSPLGETPNWVWSKPNRQYFPSRVYLTVTSVAYAEAYGLPMARLQSGRGADGQRTFVGPTPAAMAEALRHMVVDDSSGTRRVDHAALPATAYPGTLPIYLAVPTAGLPDDAAADYAEFVRRAVSARHQTLGGAIGQLPPGYLPLPDDLRRQALTLADAVARQAADPDPTTPPPTTPAANGGNGTQPPASVPTPGSTPSPSPTPKASVTPSAGTPQPQVRALTRTDTSALGAWALPAVLGTGLLVLLVIPFVLLAAQPDHPVRRLVRSAGRVLRRTGS